MSASDSLDTTVLIVGAGPVGILTGLLLNRLGISFVIVERRSSLHNAPQAHVISSRSLEICRAVGVDDMKIRSLGPKLEDTATIRWVDTLAGRDLGVFDMRRRPEDIGRMLTSTPTPSTNLSQDQFERVLFARLSEVAGSDVLRFEHGWEGVKEETDSEGSVTYLSSISTDSGPLELRSRYLIGADGAGSRVRKAAGFDMVGPDNIQTYINVHFKANLRELVSGREGILYWVMDEALTGTFIAHDIDSNWIFMKAVDADEPIDSIDEDKFATLLKAAIGADVPIEIQSMNAWRMTAQISSGYRAGGIFLVGDAAHRFPPTGGIGMNTGFQDAHNLVWKVGMVERGMAPEILATYEPERKPIAQTNSDQSLHNALKMIEVAVALDVDGDQRITAGDIDAVLADPERLAAVQTAVDAQAEHFNLSGLDLGLCYTGAAVLEDGPPPVSDNPASNYLPSTTPGARLPHATLLKDGEPISTLDLVPYDHLLILSQGDRHPGLDAAVETLRGEGVPVHLEIFGSGTAAPPTDDAAFAALFPADELLLVRPDGHIAGRFRGDNAAQEACRACAGLWSP